METAVFIVVTVHFTLSLIFSVLSGSPPPPPRFLSSVMFGSFSLPGTMCHISRLRGKEGGRRV